MKQYGTRRGPVLLPRGRAVHQALNEDVVIDANLWTAIAAVLMLSPGPPRR